MNSRRPRPQVQPRGPEKKPKIKEQGPRRGTLQNGGKPGLKAGNKQAAEWWRVERTFIPSDDESKGWKDTKS